MKDNKLYIWDGTTKKGTMMALDLNLQDQAQGQGQADKKTETIENLEKYKDYCRAENVSDSLFAVPTDVEFVDLESQLKNSGVDLQKMMEQYKTTPSQ